MLAVINDRIQHCRHQSELTNPSTGCDVCGTTVPCRNAGSRKSQSQGDR
jgi:hypothetical protein